MVSASDISGYCFTPFSLQAPFQYGSPPWFCLLCGQEPSYCLLLLLPNTLLLINCLTGLTSLNPGYDFTKRRLVTPATQHPHRNSLPLFPCNPLSLTCHRTRQPSQLQIETGPSFDHHYHLPIPLLLPSFGTPLSRGN